MVAIIAFFFLFRRLNTLNKCASMKLDVNFQRKKVGVRTLKALAIPAEGVRIHR